MASVNLPTSFLGMTNYVAVITLRSLIDFAESFVRGRVPISIISSFNRLLASQCGIVVVVEVVE